MVCDIDGYWPKYRRFVSNDILWVTLTRHTGKNGAEKEGWRKVKKLGSLLVDRAHY